MLVGFAIPALLPTLAANKMQETHLQIDPLNSDHPIPWNWVLATQSDVDPVQGSKMRYYRSQSLISPDGQYAAYSRIQMKVQPDLFSSWVSSVLFLENLRTGDLQAVTASSPLSDNPFSSDSTLDKSGTIAILIPISWSAEGDCLLAREFESLFGSSMASDYATIWNRRLNRASTVSPNRRQYTNAILMGWSKIFPGRALFKAGNLGEESWPLLAVDASGHTVMSADDRPLTFGQPMNNIWAGPQAVSR